MKKIIYIVIIIAIILSIYILKNYNEGKIVMNNSKKIEKIWDKMFEYWKKIESKPYCNKATNEEIEKFQKTLKLELPNSFVNSLKICNGEKIDILYEKKYNDLIENNPYEDIKLGIIGLFDINKILEYRYIAEDTPNDWIPLAYWYGAYVAILDTRKDTFGQVLLGVEELGVYKVWANNYEEWLEIVSNEVIKNGEIKEEFLEKIYNNKNLKEYHYPDYK